MKGDENITNNERREKKNQSREIPKIHNNELVGERERLKQY